MAFAVRSNGLQTLEINRKMCYNYKCISVLREVRFLKNVDDLIELIMGDTKLQELSEKVYHDEPILKRASQLVQDVLPKKETPPKLMEMRRMAVLQAGQVHG